MVEHLGYGMFRHVLKILLRQRPDMKPKQKQFDIQMKSKNSGIVSVEHGCVTLPVRRRGAFTLIELLVVVAIISLLVSILLPSLGKAKNLAQQIACTSHVRQMGMAMQLYAGDYDGYKPAPRLNNTYSGLWFFALGGGRSEPFQDGYLPNPMNPGGASLWKCPSYSYPPAVALCYGMSRSHGFNIPFRMDYTTAFQSYNTYDPKPNGQPAANASMVSVFGCGCISDSSLFRRLFSPAESYPDPLNSGLYVWHDGGSPFVFIDGHVEPRTYDFLVDSSGSGPSENSEYDNFWGHLF